MMKPVKRVFLILGAMSMFSLFQFDAMGANDCTKDPDPGTYCAKRGSKPDCPSGCWCEGGSGYHTDGRLTRTRIEEICRNKDANVDELRKMHYARIYVCGISYSLIQGEGNVEGFAGKYINGKPSSAYDTGLNSFSNPKVEKKEGCMIQTSKKTISAGWYHDGMSSQHACRKDCFCLGDEGRGNRFPVVNLDISIVDDACASRISDVHGGFNVKAYLEARGVFYCPSAYETIAMRNGKITDCVLKSDNSVHYEFTCPSDRPLRQDDGQCVACQPETEWVATQNACVSRHRVTYNCGISGTGTPPADSHNYLVGETVTVKSKGNCQGPGGGVFDKWRCNSNNNIEDTTPGSSFTMPDADVVCTAQWIAGSGGGGNTGGNGTTCATGQYLVYGTAEPADITQRVDINRYEIEDVAPVSKRTNPNNNKAFAETNANNDKASGETKANLSRSVVSRVAKPLPDVGQSAPKSLPAGMGGTCKDCEAGYYCPNKQHRYRCEDGTYTSATGQTSCQTCSGTVTHPANNSSLNTGCSTDTTATYKVTYKCGEGSGTPPTDSNSYSAGELGTFAFTLRDKGYCTAPSATPDFDGWNCGNNIVGQAGESITVPAADVICTAQWTCANGYVWGNGNICIPANNCDGENQFVADDFCFTCPANSSVNETGDGCVTDSGQDVPPISPTGSVTCGTGEYIDDDGVCQTCPTGRFCPGNGNYYTCPFGSPTFNKASCSFSLNESKLYHGQSTSGNCWKHLNNASNYRDCMYGFHLESLRGN